MKAILTSLRAAPGVWIGVFLYLSVVQTVMSGMTLIAGSSRYTQANAQGGLAEDAYQMTRMMDTDQLPITIIVGVFITLWVVSAAINQQRKQLALLAMQGATPIQLTALMELLVLVLGLTASILSAAVAPLVAPAFFKYLLRTYSTMADSYTYHADARSWFLGVAIGLATALIGTTLTVRSASRVDPVEAYRSQPVTSKRPGGIRILLALASFLGAVYVFILPARSVHRVDLSGGKAAMKTFYEDMGTMYYSAIGGLLLLMIAFAFLAPLLYGGLVRLWTSLVPFPAAPWALARRQTVSRIERSSSVLAPLMVCVGLIMGMGTPIQIFSASLLRVAGYSTPPGTTSTGMPGVIGAIGPEAVVALGGALAGFCMVSRERGFDQALLDISGAEPRQLRFMALLEGSIIMLTAMLAAFLIVIPATACAYFDIRAILGTAVLSISWSLWFRMTLAVSALGSLIFLLASVRALRTPAIELLSAQAGQ
ncbi:hypothetical protein BACT_1169 [Bifidobacterium actinocoloniiforme DSM 22766]|uniref:ABC3 transporter permease C-terminal domain-containing protein n=1 Tax=Bifidobacterium actinocoloniiforme DSM 22766 TaxID=1437605 RepID=A0A086Z1R5_9BIFI|nr:ABC transporter permease [Bifidobacterium actinocoloniiforme]AKV55578.1 hypothetical protein AB656_04460 [Bifidobacterium actinocoloniiforme DSM 22766]KFI40465.1 hypothetical protein BACT_1169 [Bifidobacterium actinocoloniiforme DSM 22766]